VFSVLVFAVAYDAYLRVSQLKEEFDVKLSTMQGEVNYLESRINELQTQNDEHFAVLADLASTNEEYEVVEQYAPSEPSAFDMRISQFRDELNTTTHERPQEPAYHPGVYDVPHSSVRDVPIKFEPEYAE